MLKGSKLLLLFICILIKNSYKNLRQDVKTHNGKLKLFL